MSVFQGLFVVFVFEGLHVACLHVINCLVLSVLYVASVFKKLQKCAPKMVVSVLKDLSVLGLFLEVAFVTVTLFFICLLIDLNIYSHLGGVEWR